MMFRRKTVCLDPLGWGTICLSDERGNAASCLLRIQPATKLRLNWALSSPKDFCRCYHLWSLEETSVGGRAGSLSIQCRLLYARLYALLWIKHLNEVNASSSQLSPNVFSPQNVAPPISDSIFVYVWMNACAYVEARNCIRRLPQYLAILLFWDEISHWILRSPVQLDWLVNKCPGPSVLHLPGLGLQVHPVPQTPSFPHGFWELKTGPYWLKGLPSSLIVFFVGLYHNPVQLQLYLFVVWLFCFTVSFKRLKISQSGKGKQTGTPRNIIN